MDAKIAAIINGMNIQEINNIIEELELPENSHINDVIAKACEIMRDGVLTKLFIQEFNKYMPFSIILYKNPVRGFHNLIKEYLKIVSTINFEEAGPILKEFMSYDASAIDHYGDEFISLTCDTVRNVQESCNNSDHDTEDLYNIDMYEKLRTSDGSCNIDPVSFVKDVIGISSVVSKNNLYGYPIFNWNMKTRYVTAFLKYLENKFC
ncbi:alpha-amanitin target [Murmansk poxvirus]|uniref:Alpha-amanitin target n=1 Tax=Murmansk poxvirus TaxID=2025359 RepID=A0A223FMJ5_9POXV|nr:alpha-amanitin target [Murmansk poxvirus]AST09200.1 alpha-amanitin target [Murmansk poxvirus]